MSLADTFLNSDDPRLRARAGEARSTRRHSGGTVIHATRARGEGLQQAGVGLLVAGGVGIVSSVIWVALTGRGEPAVAVLASPAGGAVIAVTGSLP